MRSFKRLVPILLILAIAAVLRARHIGQDSLSGDEVLSLTLAKMNLVDLVRFDREWEQIPPLHHIFLHFWVPVFGQSETSIRMPSAIFGVAAVWIMYLLMRDTLRGPMGHRAGLIASLSLAVSPVHLEYAQDCRTYAMHVLLGLISCDLFVRLLRRPTHARQAAYVIVSAAMMYAHLYAAFTLLAQSLVYAFIWLRRRQTQHPMPLTLGTWIRANIAIIALFAPWIPTALAWTKQVNVSFWVKRVTVDDIARAYWFFCGSTAVFVFIVALVVIGITVWRRHIERIAIPAGLMLVPIVVPVIISIAGKPSFSPRYGIMGSIGMYALAAMGLAAIRPAVLRWALLAVVAILSPLGDAPVIARQPWRDVAQFLQKNMRPGDLAVVNVRYGVRLYDYYVNRPDVRRVPSDSSSVPVSLPLENGRRVWLILYEPFYPAQKILERAPWRIERRMQTWGVTALELTDTPDPTASTSPSPASPATTPSP